jgi:hypothetical protein
MRDEAEQMHMMMRLAKTRGQHPYHTDFHEHYTQYDRHKPDKEGMLLNEDGTFCGDLYQTTFISAHEQQAIINRIKRSGMDLKYRMQLGKRDTILKSTRKAVEKKSPIRAFELKSMLTACGAFRTKCGEVMGDEVEMIAKQVLADPFFTMYPAKYVESQGKAALIAAQQQRACDDHMREAGLPVLTYDSIETVLKSLERYTSKGVNAKGKQLAVPPGPGANEIYVGSLQMIFPVHNDEELKSLRDNWGNAGWMFKLQVGVWRNEGADSLALGHPSRELYSERFGFLYQPIDEIRDYFGDDNAIYFSWLGTYTKALIPASALGLLTMFNQPLAGGVDENQLTVYYSFFLSLWSVLFLSVWKRQEAVHAFLWGSEGFEATEEPRPDFKGILIVNKETGAEDFQHGSFLPRATRKMVSSCIIAFCMVVTVFGALTASSLKNRLPKECNLNIWVEKTSYDGLPCGAVNDEDLGAVDCCFCTDVLQCPNYNEVDANGTVTLDRVKHDMEKWGELTPTEKFGWQLLSSFLNLGIIITAGLVYEAIADWLNDLENFRTETEYSDGLILKNFLFQFVNNYFLLFYIAYLRQIEFESLGIAAKRCDQSCLSELQMQMFVVFSGKTIALQGVELAKPIIQAKFKVVMELMQVRKVMKMASNASEALAQSVMTDTQLRELGLDEESIEEQKQREVHKEALSKRGSKDKSKMTDPYELQSHMVNYEDDRGTFDDFNEMAIQYGYIALFSPCFPLAPLLAFLNNVTEIRVDAWKLCKGYQRCTASPKEDIGSWFAVLNIIGFIAVLTNATMIVFVGSQLAQTPTEELGIEERLNSRHLWVKGIAIEHSVMLMRVFVVIFMPTYPGWIADAKDVLRFHINEMERAVKNREALWGDESELNKEFTELLMDSEGVLRASEFFSADENRDTKLNRKVGPLIAVHSAARPKSVLLVQEFESKFGDIGIKFEDMDVNHDGTITIKEFTAFVNARRAEEGRVRERQRKLQAQKAKRTAE